MSRVPLSSRTANLKARTLPGPTEPPRPSRRYSAAVLGTGEVMPITETLGRRLIREIDPLSAEGRSLLAAGEVTLLLDDGSRCEAAPIQVVLEQMSSQVRARRDTCPQEQSWRAHHDRVLKSIASMKRRLTTHH